MALLTVNQLTKRYDKTIAVHPMDFQLNEEKCVALLGPNGAGKTTVLRMLAGLLKPTDGQMKFNLTTYNNGDFRKWIGYLPQYPVFHSWMTAREFLIYVGQLAHLSKQEATKRADDLLVKVGLNDAKNRRIGKYSGGMKQRLGIAQAIIHRPKLLLLDEPVASLDPLGRREVLELMEELKQEMTILFSTHILSDADEISDELLLLAKGKLIENGSIIDLRTKYQTKQISIQFTDEAINYLPKIEENIGVTAHANKQTIHVPITSEGNIRKQLLALAAKEDWPITSFTINQTSLEALFMKAVEQQ